MQGRPIRAILEMVILPASSFSGYGAYHGPTAILKAKCAKFSSRGLCPRTPGPSPGQAVWVRSQGLSFANANRKVHHFLGASPRASTRIIT